MVQRHSFFIAAHAGHERVVKTLLERVDVNRDLKDLTGQTALLEAQQRGHDAVVKLLSEHRNSLPSLYSHGFTASPSPEPSDPNQRPSKRIRRV